MTIVIRYRVLVSDSFDIQQTGKALDPQVDLLAFGDGKHESPHTNVEAAKCRPKSRSMVLS
jgi:hypothetical protein